MALPHAQPLEVIDICPLGPALHDTATTSLLKTPRLQQGGIGCYKDTTDTGTRRSFHIPITIADHQGRCGVHAVSRHCAFQ